MSGIFEYSPSCKKLKAHTDIENKQHQGLDKAFISNKDNRNVNKSLIKKENKKKKYNMANLIYNRLSFYSYSDDKKSNSLSFKSKHSYLLNCKK